MRLAPLNRFKPSSKIFCWHFQGGTSFVDILWVFFLSCVCYVFVRVCFYVFCGHLLGKGLPLGSRLWCLTVRLSLSHWYRGSGVVLDCIDSWSLHPYLLSVCIRSGFSWNAHTFPRHKQLINSSPYYKWNTDFPCLADEIAKPRPDMNIKLQPLQ